MTGSAASIESPSTSETHAEEPLDERGDHRSGGSPQQAARAWTAAARARRGTSGSARRRRIPSFIIDHEHVFHARYYPRRTAGGFSRRLWQVGQLQIDARSLGNRPVIAAAVVAR